MEVDTVIVVPVTEQPLAMTVVEGEQAVVRTVTPPVWNDVGTHSTVTWNAVFKDAQDEDDDGNGEEGELVSILVDEPESELVLEVLSSSVRSSVSVLKLFRESLTPSRSSILMLSVMLSRSSPIQDKLLTIPLIVPIKPLFLLEPHPEKEESGPKLEMRSSTSFLTDLTLVRVSDLSEVGFAFQELMTGTRPASSEDTEDTLDVASELAMVVVIGGRVIGDEYDPSVITDTVSVLLC